jgi:ATP-dependent helicase HrpB
LVALGVRPRMEPNSLRANETPMPLPIDAVLPRIRESLAAQPSLVLSASPGSGKTTRVPPAMLDWLPKDAGQIWVLEPRRIAARAAARFVASERGQRVGEEIGFIVRHERKLSKSTRLVFVTEGVLLRRLVQDPDLPGIAAVVLDEFHERHVETDLCLAMLREVRDTLRDDLHLLVMSATLESEPLRDYLSCPSIEAPGRQYPIETTWDERRDDAPLAQRIAHACEALIEQLQAKPKRPSLESARDQSPLPDAPPDALPGGILCFVPGQREIQDACHALGPLAHRGGYELLPLSGSLSAAEQDRAIRPSPRPKLVVATNVAESSITVDGIRAVVDSGLARIPRRDPRSGLDALRTETISMASAKQRRGRAGRQAPGLCHRLWTKGEERLRPQHDEPELLRVELSGPLLAVRSFAGRNLRSFAWFQEPSQAAVDQADRELRMLGAIEANGSLTKKGKSILGRPLPPRLACLVLAAREHDCEFEAATTACLLAERDPFTRPPAEASDGSGLEARIHALGQAQDARSDAELRSLGLDPHGARRILRSIRQLAGDARPHPRFEREQLARALLAGYPDRVARRVTEDSLEADLSTGQRVQLRRGALPPGQHLFLALELRELDAGRVARVSHPLPIEESWLEPALLVTGIEAQWMPKESRVRALRRTRYLGLTIRETLLGDADKELARPLLEEQLRKDPARWFGKQKALRALQARVTWLQENAPQLELPDISDRQLVDFAIELLEGSRLDTLARLDLAPLVLARHTSLRQLLEREAPESIPLPTGRSAMIDYAAQAGPTVSARIQELLGCTALPRIAGGKLSLVVELLGPNHRPVQVTSDLGGFWERSYPEIRKELKRRYPKHSWPEDPLNAEPESRPQRKR